MNKISLLLLVLILISVALLGYFFSKNRELLNQTENPVNIDRQISTLPSSSPNEATSSPVASPPNLNPSQVQTLIRNLVNSKNYQGLEPHMKSPTVLVSLASSDCCGNLTPEETSSQMAYLNNGVPYEFNQDSLQIKQIKSENPRLNNFFMGISNKNEMVVSFKINQKGQIEEVEMAASYELY